MERTGLNIPAARHWSKLGWYLKDLNWPNRLCVLHFALLASLRKRNSLP